MTQMKIIYIKIVHYKVEKSCLCILLLSLQLSIMTCLLQVRCWLQIITPCNKTPYWPSWPGPTERPLEAQGGPCCSGTPSHHLGPSPASHTGHQEPSLITALRTADIQAQTADDGQISPHPFTSREEGVLHVPEAHGYILYRTFLVTSSCVLNSGPTLLYNRLAGGSDAPQRKPLEPRTEIRSVREGWCPRDSWRTSTGIKKGSSAKLWSVRTAASAD